jgi:pyruvate,water dikinase
VVDPDRWEINRETRSVITWLPGEREGGDEAPLLVVRDLEAILESLLSIEQLFRWSPDMEWTGRSESLTLLQARPITTAPPDGDEKRNWYLALRPGDARLKKLRERVVNQLIPELEAEGEALAVEKIDLLDDSQLADALEKRSKSVTKWKRIYWDEFIPFAHGVRRLATYYNDAVQPEYPYEFVDLLRGQPLLAAQRNRAIAELARQLASNDALRAAVEEVLEEHAGALQWPKIREELMLTTDGAESFARGLEDLMERFFDIAYDHERLHDQTDLLLRNLLELSRNPDTPADSEASAADAVLLERRLLDAVGAERRDEAIEIIETGRISWKLRDDDNLLVARLESQLLRAIDVATKRLRDCGKLTGGGRPDGSHVEMLARALRDGSSSPIERRARHRVN